MPVIEMWPQLQPGLELYWTAYHEISTDRPQSISEIAPIPFSAIARYAKIFGICGEDFEDLLYFVRAMDRTFLEWVDNKKQPKATQGKVKF